MTRRNIGLLRNVEEFENFNSTFSNISHSSPSIYRFEFKVLEFIEFTWGIELYAPLEFII